MATKKTTARSKKSTRPAKPLFSPATWVMLVLLVLLIGVYFILKDQQETAEAEATPTPGATSLFGPEEGSPTTIEAQPAEGEGTKLMRSNQGVWTLEAPINAEANQALAEGAASQAAALKMEQELEDGDLEIFGLDTPAYVITIGFDSGSTHVLEVGDTTPTNSGYYVRLDQDRLMIVGRNGIDALINLITSPPYLNTPTPSPLPPTETAIPTQTQTPTP